VGDAAFTLVKGFPGKGPGRPVTGHPAGVTASIRHAEALRARRSELARARAVLGGGHRARLRSELAVARLGAEAELAALHRDLRADCAAWLVGRRRRLLAPVLGPAAARAGAEWLAHSESRALAVIAGVRGRAAPEQIVCPRSPSANLPERSGPDGPPAPSGGLAVALRGADALRLALVPVAGVPALGLTAAAARPLLPLAAGLALALVLALVHRRREALERERWSAWVEVVLARAGAQARTALTARLLVLEQEAGEQLDRLVAARTAEIGRELAALEEVDGG
jgi:hypothetical protein